MILLNNELLLLLLFFNIIIINNLLKILHVDKSNKHVIECHFDLT